MPEIEEYIYAGNNTLQSFNNKLNVIYLIYNV